MTHMTYTTSLRYIAIRLSTYRVIFFLHKSTNQIIPETLLKTVDERRGGYV